MDIPLLVIISLITATLLAWASGLFVYPYGILVLLAVMVTRVIQLYSKDKN